MYAKRLAAAKAGVESRSVAESSAASTEVGITELRGNLAKYLRRAKAGRAVVVLERGERAYVLQRIEPTTPAAIFGCMRERTRLSNGQPVLTASEDWSAGALP